MTRFLFASVAVVLVACSAEEAPAPVVPSEEATSPVVPTVEADDDGRPRVVFLGTSLTAGLGLASEEDSYVAQIAALADSAGTPIHAINAGVSGETSAGGLRRLDWVLREPLDVLVLELGANDGLRGHDPLTLEANLREIVERTRTRYPGTPVVIAGMQAPPNFGFMYTTRFAAVFPLVAEETSSALVPFLLDSVAGIPELNQADQIHPTVEGHGIMARNVWRVLSNIIDTLGAPGA
ncbi:MAG: arylesterase [Gemmatimonadales bacterium]|jgi:acyl-CoA thioesterase I|nr:arylesterase [Gemmatimonadales bacterium]MDG2240392.1 arylesterase [Longimicrobiales bacterium]NCG34038.1 arylesterase [Pseudomonadota bacterium]MBT3499144.1 arylesterase [Gemmatimonadales bacterium]MBT3774994.1 arylesterase [Gemmatimonadales bacterium]